MSVEHATASAEPPHNARRRSPRRFLAYVLCLAVPTVAVLFTVRTLYHAHQNAGLLNAIKAADTGAALACLRRGADPRVRFPGGTAAIWLAAGRGEERVVRALLAAGVPADERDPDGGTPLMAAASVRSNIDRPGADATVRLLLDHGADPDSRGPGGATALMAAACADSGASVLALLKRGADADARDNDRHTCLFIPAMHSLRIYRLLRTRVRKPDLWGPIAADDSELVAVALRQGADPNGTTSAGEGCLVFAAGRGSVGAVRALLAGGADPRRPDRNGWTPLGSAAYLHWSEVTRALLRAGADPNVPGRLGLALITAVHRKDTGSVELLLRHGARIPAPPVGHEPLLDTARRNGMPANTLRLLAKTARRGLLTVPGAWPDSRIAARAASVTVAPPSP